MITLLANVAGKFGVNNKEAERFIKFMIVGLIGFVVDFGFFNLFLTPFDHLLAEGASLHNAFVSLGLSPERTLMLGPSIAGTCSFILAIISNFMWNRYWTYPESRSKSFRAQFAMFAVVSFAGILIRIPIITFTHDPFINLVSTVPSLVPYAERLGENLALALAVLVVMFWNFFINRYWTYSDVKN